MLEECTGPKIFLGISDDLAYTHGGCVARVPILDRLRIWQSLMLNPANKPAEVIRACGDNIPDAYQGTHNRRSDDLLTLYCGNFVFGLLCELEKGACPEWQDLWFEANEAPAPPAVDLFNLNEPQVAAEIAHVIVNAHLGIGESILEGALLYRTEVSNQTHAVAWEININRVNPDDAAVVRERHLVDAVTGRYIRELSA